MIYFLSHARVQVSRIVLSSKDVDWDPCFILKGTCLSEYVPYCFNQPSCMSLVIFDSSCKFIPLAVSQFRCDAIVPVFAFQVHTSHIAIVKAKFDIMPHPWSLLWVRLLATPIGWLKFGIFSLSKDTEGIPDPPSVPFYITLFLSKLCVIVVYSVNVCWSYNL